MSIETIKLSESAFKKLYDRGFKEVEYIRALPMVDSKGIELKTRHVVAFHINLN